MDIEYVDREAALAAFAEAMEVSFAGARDAVLSENQLESALARPQNAASYADADLIGQAATLFWAIISNHPFRDGNKRTAVVLLYAFLRTNDGDLALSDDELFSLAMTVAAGSFSVEQVDAVIRPALIVNSEADEPSG